MDRNSFRFCRIFTTRHIASYRERREFPENSAKEVASGCSVLSGTPIPPVHRCLHSERLRAESSGPWTVPKGRVQSRGCRREDAKALNSAIEPCRVRWMGSSVSVWVCPLRLSLQYGSVRGQGRTHARDFRGSRTSPTEPARNPHFFLVLPKSSP